MPARTAATRVWIACPECGCMLKLRAYQAEFGRMMPSRCSGTFFGKDRHAYVHYICVGTLPETHDRDHVIAVAKLLAARNSQE